MGRPFHSNGRRRQAAVNAPGQLAARVSGAASAVAGLRGDPTGSAGSSSWSRVCDGGSCAVRIGDRVFHCGQGDLDTRGDVKVMIRPERISIEPHTEAGDARLPGIVERSVFLGGSHEVHVRVLGGELMRATVANDGTPPPVSLDPGSAVSLRLPPEVLRVLRPSEAGTEEAPDEDETLLVRDADDKVPATVPPGATT